MTIDDRLMAAMEAGEEKAGYASFRARWGDVPVPTKASRAHAVAEIEASGLRGHGGAWFPVGRKWRAAAAGRRRPVLVANATEGEPASAKDASLLTRAPHLVIDGAMYAASSVGASRVVFFAAPHLTGAVSRALGERPRSDPVPVSVVTAPPGYLAGEESAAVNFLNGGPPTTPLFTKVTPTYVRGVDRAPTLLHNVETLAHSALIARFGASWYRREGTVETPGTALVTVRGAVRTPKVLEVPMGARVSSLIGGAGGATAPLQGVLVGGYGGTWLDPSQLETGFAPETLKPLGASPGAGVVVAVSEALCPLAQAAHVVRYMESQAAGQCGPCIHGLPAMHAGLNALAFGRAKAKVVDEILVVCDLVEGRGACHHPDGVAQFVRSALAVFADDVRAHLRSGPCGREARMALPARRANEGQLLTAGAVA